MDSVKQLPLKIFWFYVGLVITVSGYMLIVKPGLGASPWDIFHFGVVGTLGLPLFFVVQATGVVLIALNWVLGIKPTLGMVLNMLSVGPIAQLILAVLPQPETPALRWLMLGAGIFCSGLGTALYASANIGTGPRDGMMIGLTRRFGVPVGMVKNGIDITVATLGYLLGGPLGLGTVVVALLLGPSMAMGMRITTWVATLPGFHRFVHPVNLKRTPVAPAVPVPAAQGD